MTYDTHDLADLRAALGCEHSASIDEIRSSARRLRAAAMERADALAMIADAIGCGILEGRTGDIMRRIGALREAEADLDKAREALGIQAEMIVREECRWTRATQTLASLRAPIDALRAAARLDEALTDVEVIEHAAAALERWREAAEARPEGHSMAAVLNSLPAVEGHSWSVTARGRVVRLRDASGALVATARRHDSGWWLLTIGDRAVGDFACLDDIARVVAAEMARRRTDLPPMVVGWRPLGAHDHVLVRVEGDDETVLFEARWVRPADGIWAWQVYPRAHHDGHAGTLPPLTQMALGDATAMILALVRAANPDRRVTLEAPCAP